MQTKKTHRILTRLTYKAPKEPLIIVGPNGNIRTVTDLGLLRASKLPNDLLIDGCDWVGALCLYRYLRPSHPSLLHDDTWFFSKTSEPDNCLFLIIFHHIYNIGLQKEPWLFPPFRSSIVEKIAYLKVFLTHNPVPFNIEESELDNLVEDVQKALRLKVYESWDNFLAKFTADDSDTISFTTSDSSRAVTEQMRLEKLATNCMNGPDLLEFLRSPIDSTSILQNIVYEESINSDDIIDDLCNLMLDKLDQHSIFLQTGVKPITIDWIRKLDLIILNK